MRAQCLSATSCVLRGESSDVAALRPALAFRIVPGPRLEWEAQPDPALSRGWSASPDLLDLSGDAQSALSEASAWLLDYMAAGPRPARRVLRAARAAGVSIATLRRAKRICRVRSVKPDLQSAWLWSAEQPSDNKDAPIRGGAQMSTLGTFALIALERG
jgi:hypothetical protein